MLRSLLMLTVLAATPQLSLGAELNLIVSDQNGKTIENAVVYAESTGKQTPIDSATAAIEQQGKKFIPLVSVIQAGSSVTFPNRDSVKHHVYSFSPAKTFELKLYSGVPPTPVLFDKAGTVVLGCNIHDQMIAYVRVVETPYFDKSDNAGKVKLEIPDGSYVLKVWHYNQSKENETYEKAISAKGSQQIAVKLDIKN